nr:glycosyltransferase family 2 protein [Actinomycetota bacterium]
HLARRAVLLRHTWAVRAGQVLRQLELPAPAPDRSVSAVVPTVRPWQLDHVLETLAAQRHPDVELVLVTHGFQAPAAEVLARAADLGLDHVQVLHAASDLTLGACLNLGVAAASGRYTAKMDDDNLYGPHYLLDLVLAFEHTSAQVVGKWAHYVHLTGSDAVLLRFAGQEHREVDLVQGGTIVMPTDLLRELGFADLPRRVDTTLLKRVRAGDGRIWSADRFNFVSRRAADTTGHTWGITDQELLTRASSVVFYGDPTRHTTL